LVKERKDSVDDDFLNVDLEVLDYLDSLPVIETEGETAMLTCFTDEELEIIQKWGFTVSTERPFSKEEAELYFKITNV
jgi:hypothetical protein